MDRNDAILVINKVFKGLEFDYIKYNRTYDDFEVHFKNGKYFCLGAKVNLTADIREVHINPKFKKEVE